MQTIEQEPEPIEALVAKTLQTVASREAQRITEKQRQRSTNETSEEKKRKWLNKWLGLTPTHPQLERLESEIYQFCADYAKQPGTGYRLILHGENGCGKSHTAKAVSRWAKRAAIQMPLVDADEGLRLADSSFHNWASVVDSLKSPKADWEIFDEMQRVSLLVLDDVGAEHDPSGIGREKLYLILERREYKFTILTTNIAPNQWDEVLSRRIASRFLRNAKHIDLSEVPDYNSQ